MAVAPDQDLAAAVAQVLGAGWEVGTATFAGPMRAERAGSVPVEAIFCLATGGPPPIAYVGEAREVVTSSVQIMLRGAPDKLTELMARARALRAGLNMAPLTGYVDVRVREPEPNYLGKDGAERHLLTLNVNMVHVRTSTDVPVPISGVPSLDDLFASQAEFDAFVASVAATYLPLVGGHLAGPGNLQMDGTLGLGSATSWTSPNAGHRSLVRKGTAFDAFTVIGSNSNDAAVIELASTDPTGRVHGLYVSTESSPSAPSTAAVRGIAGYVYATGINHTGDTLYGLDGQALYGGTAGANVMMGVFGSVSSSLGRGASGTVASAYGLRALIANREPNVTFTDAFGVYVQEAGVVGGGTNVNKAGIVVEEVTGASRNVDLLLGTRTVPTGDWALHSVSTRSSYLAGLLGIGTTSPQTNKMLHVRRGGATAGISNVPGAAQFENLDTALTSGFTYGVSAYTEAAPVAASTATYRGLNGQVGMTGGTVEGATGVGVEGLASYGTATGMGSGVLMGLEGRVSVSGGSGTLATGIGLNVRVDASTAAVSVTDAYGIRVQDGAETGAVTRRIGIAVEEQAGATNNVDLLLGTLAAPAGDWALYSASTRDSFLAGALKIGGNVGFYGTAPIAQQTGVPVTAAAIHAALVNLGLITA